MKRARGAERSWLAPEVVQTSPMDCGPASLACVLAGHGLRADFGRLREACQTDVDGTSIDVIADVARELGLDAQQILVPLDHVASPHTNTLPAILVVRLSSGANHFAVVWRRVGPWVQIMDPASGRRWIRARELRRNAYVHGRDLPAAAWRAFAAAPAHQAFLAAALAEIGVRDAQQLCASALADASWRSIAALDAAARLVGSLVRAGSIARGAGAARLVESLFESARSGDIATQAAIPAAYWPVRPHAAGADGEVRLHVVDALLVRIRGRARTSDVDTVKPPARPRLSPSLADAIAAPSVRIARTIFEQLRAEGLLRLQTLTLLALLSAGLVLGQALLFRALFDLPAALGLDEQRFAAAAALLVFVAAGCLLELPLAAGILRLGRHVEARLRIAFQSKIPRLPERYFGSRPSSDMAERAHGLVLMRSLPALGFRFARTLFQIVFTAAGLIWLDPAGWPLVALAATAAALLPFAFGRALGERELALRSHHGALSRFYLDALLGLVAVRVHGAEKNLRREHESILVEWVKAGLAFARAATWVRAASSIAGFGLAAALVARHVSRGASAEGALLYGYWALSLPALGEQLAQTALQWPAVCNAVRRALEPLGASEDPRAISAVDSRAAVERAADAVFTPGETALKAAGAGGAAAPSREHAPASSTPRARTSGVAIELANVALVASGHTLLSQIELTLRPGEHVALVGPSGAGKSSLIALLLGFHAPSSGSITVDGHAFDALALRELRRTCAWVDPAAQLWNRSLFDNLVYGSGVTSTAELSDAIARAELGELFETLPAGLESPLGEGGALLSGGEGQRVRLARALLRQDIRLALLDEPFRGLARDRRRALLARARAHWRAATLVCATHDLEETLAFDRVIVIEHGLIVEDGAPRLLAARASSRYAALLEAERAVQRDIWSHPMWTRWRVADGRVDVVPAPEVHT